MKIPRVPERALIYIVLAVGAASIFYFYFVAPAENTALEPLSTEAKYTLLDNLAQKNAASALSDEEKLKLLESLK